MEVVAVTCKVNSPVKLRIVLGCLIFQLEGKCQVLLYVGIWQIVQGTFGCRITQSIVKKDLGCGFSIDFCYKMAVLGDAVPM